MALSEYYVVQPLQKLAMQVFQSYIAEFIKIPKAQLARSLKAL